MSMAFYEHIQFINIDNFTPLRGWTLLIHILILLSGRSLMQRPTE
jgi:hypothetical protein